MVIWCFYTPRFFSYLVSKDVGLILIFTYFQDKELSKVKKTGLPYFMPARADEYVVALKRWILKYTNGGPDWLVDVSNDSLEPDSDNRKLLDRYHTVCLNFDQIF